jgi:hypothetical protein
VWSVTTPRKEIKCYSSVVTDHTLKKKEYYKKLNDFVSRDTKFDEKVERNWFMKKRQLKKLCKKTEVFFPNKAEGKHAEQTWTFLKQRFRGALILNYGIFVKRPKETPRRVFTWARENIESYN